MTTQDSTTAVAGISRRTAIKAAAAGVGLASMAAGVGGGKAVAQGKGRTFVLIHWTSPGKVQGFSDRIGESGEHSWVRPRQTEDA